MSRQSLIKVVVVEDEPIILNNIVKRIESSDRAFTVVATAMNGKDALEKIYSYKADMVFTDIRMPVMDGIELIRFLRVSFPDMPIVIITGFNDFEYMKESIDLSVYAYLLKPLEQYEVDKVLIKAKAEITRRMKQETKEILTSKIYLENTKQSMPFNSENEEFVIFMINIGNLTTQLLSIQNREIFSEIWSSILWEKIVSEVMPDMNEWWLVDETISNQKFLVVSSDKSRLSLFQYAKELSELLEAHTQGFSVSIAIPPASISYNEIETYAKSLRILMDDRLIMCRSQIIQSKLSQEQIMSNIQESVINEAIEINDVGLLKEALVAIFRQWVREYLPQRMVEKQLVDLMTVIIKKVGKANVKEVSKYMRLVYERASIEKDMDEFIAYVCEQIKQLINQNNQSKHTTEGIVKEIKRYIDDNYSMDISLTKLAEELHFTPAYLTKIFKKYEGLTPVKYITNLRINKAKELLKSHNDLQIGSIAKMVGYDEFHYFSRVFRTAVGMTPTEYRNQALDSTP